MIHFILVPIPAMPARMCVYKAPADTESHYSMYTLRLDNASEKQSKFPTIRFPEWHVQRVLDNLCKSVEQGVKATLASALEQATHHAVGVAIAQGALIRSNLPL